MKSSAYVTALASTGAVAQLDVITGAMAKVGNSVNALDSAVKAFSSDFSPVQAKASDLINTLKQGKTSVDGAKSLSLDDALLLTQPTQNLVTSSQTLQQDFLARRDKIQQAGLCDTVRSSLSQISDASKALIDAVTAKIPKEAQEVAAKMAGKDIDILNAAQADFSKENCTASSAGNQTVAASTSAPAPTTTSSVAAGATMLAPLSLGMVAVAALF